MGVRHQLKVLEFLNKWVNEGVDESAFQDDKTKKKMTGQKLFVKEPLTRAIPETQGVSSKFLVKFFKKIGEDRKISPHSIMVLRNGYVIGEISYHPYQQQIWHVTHSLAKTVTGLAIGMAVEEGLLHTGDKLSDIFKGEQKGIYAVGKRTGASVTIKHLLTMSSGVAFNEAGILVSKQWKKEFLASATVFTPGSKFQYNSMNSYMLSAVIQKVSGQNLNDYLQQRLWKPLGIIRPYWQLSPEGIETGGFGLYLTIEDVAKIGQLLLQKGKWKQQQIVSKKWIAYACKKHMETPKNISPYGYGCHMWLAKGKGSIQANGMLGQNLYIFPKNKLVIAITAGAEEFFPKGKMTALVERYFLNTCLDRQQLSCDPIAAAKLVLFQWYQSKEHGMRVIGVKLPSGIRGKTYAVSGTKAGLLPLLMQCMHMNFTAGIKTIAFFRKSGCDYMKIIEGKDIIRIPLHFDRQVSFELCINKECYNVSVESILSHNEDGKVVLIIRLTFLEEANTRIIKIVVEHDRKLKILLHEEPRLNMIMEAVEEIVHDISGNFVMDSISHMLPKDYLDYKIQRILTPELNGNFIANSTPM